MVGAANNNWISENYTAGLVSVIIPAYNRELLLKEAIQSVVAQTYRPIECIVVDDGSIDNTKEVVRNFIKENDVNFSVKYIHQQNSGAQVARNTGTIASTGEFIQYLDSDDLLYADKLSRQVMYLNEHVECDGVFGDWQAGTLENKVTVVAYKDEDMITQMLTGRCIHTLGFLMRRKIVREIGAWDSTIKRNQEIDFHLMGLIIGAKYQYQEQECGLWRTHSNDRIANTTDLKDILFFLKKWEVILVEQKMFTPALAKKLALVYMWLSFQNLQVKDHLRIECLKHAVTLDASIPFFNTRKMKRLNKIIGKDLSIRSWLIWSRFNQQKA